MYIIGYYLGISDIIIFNNSDVTPVQLLYSKYYSTTIKLKYNI